jgi:hypothetical protein
MTGVEDNENYAEFGILIHSSAKSRTKCILLRLGVVIDVHRYEKNIEFIRKRQNYHNERY